MLSIDKLLQQFPTEDSVRAFFESIVWHRGRYCVHCGFGTTYPINGGDMWIGPVPIGHRTTPRYANCVKPPVSPSQIDVITSFSTASTHSGYSVRIRP